MSKVNQARRDKIGTALVEAAHAIERAAHVLFAYYTTTRPPAAKRRVLTPGLLEPALARQLPAERRRSMRAIEKLTIGDLALRDQLLGVDYELVISSELEPSPPTGGRKPLPGKQEIVGAIHTLIGAGVDEADAIQQAVRRIMNTWERRAFPLPSQVDPKRVDDVQRAGLKRFAALPDGETLARSVRRWYRESLPT